MCFIIQFICTVVMVRVCRWKMGSNVLCCTVLSAVSLFNEWWTITSREETARNRCLYCSFVSTDKESRCVMSNRLFPVSTESVQWWSWIWVLVSFYWNGSLISDFQIWICKHVIWPSAVSLQKRWWWWTILALQQLSRYGGAYESGLTAKCTGC